MNLDDEIRAEFDWSAMAPSMAVVETLAIASNREPTIIDPLYDSIDPDALDMLVSSDGNSAPGAELSVRFTHGGHNVTVDASGTVVIRQDEQG